MPVYKSPGFKDAALGPLTGIFHIHHLDAENQSADQQPCSHSVPQVEPQDGGGGVYTVDKNPNQSNDCLVYTGLHRKSSLEMKRSQIEKYWYFERERERDRGRERQTERERSCQCLCSSRTVRNIHSHTPSLSLSSSLALLQRRCPSINRLGFTL